MATTISGKKVRFGLVAALFALAATPVLADVKAGVDAWSAGDYARAVTEWQAPAAEGDPDAFFNLAQAYRLGRGVEVSNERARALYEEAARRGHVKAADNLGLMLFQEGEQEKAMPLIRAAAERGDPRAQYVLGLSHFNADYAPRDWVRAYALMTLAQGQGLPQAQVAITQMDSYVPLVQRQQAQSLARKLEADAKAQRRSDRGRAWQRCPGARRCKRARCHSRPCSGCVAAASCGAGEPGSGACYDHCFAWACPGEHPHRRAGACAGSGDARRRACAQACSGSGGGSDPAHGRQLARAARRLRGRGQCRADVEPAGRQSRARRHEKDAPSQRQGHPAARHRLCQRGRRQPRLRPPEAAGASLSGRRTGLSIAEGAAGFDQPHFPSALKLLVFQPQLAWGISHQRDAYAERWGGNLRRRARRHRAGQCGRADRHARFHPRAGGDGDPRWQYRCLRPTV